MSNLQQAKELVQVMTRSEKAQLLQFVAGEMAESFPGIEKTPGICGGDARIAGTRIPVWSLIEARELGYSEERLLFEYPSLRSSDLQNAWEYYAANHEEIDAQIIDNEQD